MHELVRFILNEEEERQLHWSGNLNMLLVLRGECAFSCHGELAPMKAGDLWVVNPLCLYQILRESEADILTVSFSKEATEGMKLGKEWEIFCRSDQQEENDREAFQELRRLVADLFEVCVKEKKNDSLLVKSYVCRILYFLGEGFAVKSSLEGGTEDHSLERLSRILRRIHEDYAQPLTLKQVAEEEYLSMNYLSRYFQKKAGIGFNQYLNQVRLQAAAGKLLNTALSVTEIGHLCGFKDATQFIKRFHEFYKMTPVKFRNQMLAQKEPDEREQELFYELLKYKSQETIQGHGIRERARSRKINVDVSVKGKRLRHHWKTLVNIGFAKEGLSAVIQNQLRTIQKEIGFQYIHFHGLLDDDMMLYREEEDGTPVYNYKYTDMLFDFFLSIGLKPYVELSFMPSVLSKESKKIFIKSVNMGMPNNMEKWCGLVRNLTVHLMERYGEEEVLSWRFIPWTGPVSYSYYGNYEITEYFELYRKSFEVLKLVHPEIQVGGPAMDSYYIWEDGGFYEQFIEYTERTHCSPEFLAIDLYPSKKGEKEEGEEIVLIETPEAFSRVTSWDEKYIGHLLDRLEKYHKKRDGKVPEIVFVEWNSTIWQRDLTNDTSFKAAYIAKSLLENYDRVSAFGYWGLSDYIEEVAPAQEEFHGGFGLFTCQSIKKSGYYCMELLAKLGDYMVARGDGYFITKKISGQIQIFLYNCVHFNKLYRYRHLNGVDRIHRTGAFLDGERIRYHLLLDGIGDWEFIKMREYTISEKRGSSYEAWIKMGAPSSLSAEEVLYLRQSTVPEYQCMLLSNEEFRQTELALPPQSVKLILLEKADSQ